MPPVEHLTFTSGRVISVSLGTERLGDVLRPALDEF